MEFWKKQGRKAFAKHLRNKKSKRTKRMANSKSRQDARMETRKVLKTPSQFLTSALKEVIMLKGNDTYQNRDFDSLIDAL